MRVVILNRVNTSEPLGKQCCREDKKSQMRYVRGARGFDLAALQSMAHDVTSLCRDMGVPCTVGERVLTLHVQSFGSNCRLFGSFDVLIAAHGAAMANLW